MISKTAGAAASAAWCQERDLDVTDVSHWYVEIAIPTDIDDTRFEINIYPEEWGVVFRRGVRMSSIRVTDVPFIHGRDEHRLLAVLPALERIGELLSSLERQYDVAFHRERAAVHSNFARATMIVRRWLIGSR